MNEKVSQIRLFLERRKYAITILAFVVIIGIIDENSLIVRYKQGREIAELQTQIDNYERMIKKDKKLLQDLKNDPTVIERIARERYFMKRENEDIFIFE